MHPVRRALRRGIPVFFLAAVVQAAPRAVLTQHTRSAVATGQAQRLQRMSPGETLKLNLMLPLRNEAQLDTFLQQLSDPTSPNYRQFLSVEQFTERFGPTQSDFDAAVSFAESHGLKVTGKSANRLVIDVEAPVSAIEAAFHLNMHLYRRPAEDSTFFAPDREPTVDAPIPFWHIAGLDNFSTPHPMSLGRRLTVAPAAGSGPGGEYLGSDMRAAYYGPGPLTGAGQSVGLLEFAGYNINDVKRYFSTIGQVNTVPVIGVSTDGSSLNCSSGCDDTEQALDIEQAMSFAPGLTSVRVYVSDTSDVAILTSMATENLSKSLSCSWGWSPADPSSDDPLFKEFSAQGQNFFVASGDSGAYRTHSRDVYPADDDYVVSVGGTDLTTNGPGGPWKSETGWPDSGGGISPNKIVIPTYQQLPGVITAGNKGSTAYRNAPDVAAEANFDNFICSDGGCSSGWGGTSFAAPRWAAYIALANQQTFTNTGKTLSFLNPAFYHIGLSAGYTLNFHDITSGSNGTYTAQTGFDLVTGWGSPNGPNLINLLAK